MSITLIDSHQIVIDSLNNSGFKGLPGTIFQIEQPNPEERTYFVRIFEERASAPKWHGPKVDTKGIEYIRALSLTDADGLVTEKVDTSINIAPQTPVYGVMLSYVENGLLDIATALDSTTGTWHLSQLLGLLPSDAKIGDILELVKNNDTYNYREALNFVHAGRLSTSWVRK